jgi:hypothetical protein
MYFSIALSIKGAFSSRYFSISTAYRAPLVA